MLRRALHGVIDALSTRKPNEHFLDLPRHVVLADLRHPKYQATGRAKVLGEFFGQAQLMAAKTRIFVTSYDTHGREPVLFVSRQEDASADDYHDAICEGISMFDAAMATSATPTYFPPHKVMRPNGGRGEDCQDHSLVDGGVFANNPTGLAQSFLQRGALGPDDLIVSLGTGSMTAPYKFDDIEDAGVLFWALPALKMMLDGQTEAVALALKRRSARRSTRGCRRT